MMKYNAGYKVSVIIQSWPNPWVEELEKCSICLLETVSHIEGHTLA